MKSPLEGGRAGAEGRLSPRRVQRVLEETKLSRRGGQGRLLSAPVSGGGGALGHKFSSQGGTGLEGRAALTALCLAAFAFTGWGAENATEHK